MNEIDEIIHQPIRLKIMSTLIAIKKDESVDFSFLKKTTGATDGNLGAQLTNLEKAKYISIEKKFINKKPKTLVLITEKGRKAFSQYIETLQSILFEKK